MDPPLPAKLSTDPAGRELSPRSPENPGSDAPSADAADRMFHAALARLTGGISPAALWLAYTDWLIHLSAAPARRLEIAQAASQAAGRFAEAATRSIATPWASIKPPPQDQRFAGAGWELPPFNLMAQGFLLTEEWWRHATTGVRGVSHQDEAIVDFSMRQMARRLRAVEFCREQSRGDPQDPRRPAARI